MPTARPALLLLLTALLALSGCSTANYNAATLFPYQIDKAALAEKPVKRIIIATSNFSGEPTRYHLQKAAARIDVRIKNYLEQHGYQVAPSYLFENAWNQAIRTYGEIYDPTTGRVDAQTWRAVMVSTGQALQKEGGIDAILFTDIIEQDSAHTIGLDHMAQWAGVSRKPSFARAGETSITSEFDWNQTIKVATLVVNIFNIDMKPVFSSRGGLDTLSVIDTSGGQTRYTRRKKILANDSQVNEGIALAFHPLIPLKNYPIAGK